MLSIKDYRDKIDSIDEQIIKLFKERMGCAHHIVKYKKEHNLPIYDEQREKEQILKNLEKLDDKNLEKYYLDFFKNMLRVSKEYQGDNHA